MHLARKLRCLAVLALVAFACNRQASAADIVLSMFTFDGTIDGTSQSIVIPGYSSEDWDNSNKPSNPLYETQIPGGGGAGVVIWFDGTAYATPSIASGLVGNSGVTSFYTREAVINRNYCCSQTYYIFDFLHFIGSQSPDTDFSWRYDGPNVPIESLVGVSGVFENYETYSAGTFFRGSLTLENIAQGTSPPLQLQSAPSFADEPASAMLFCLGLTALGLLSRRSRHSLPRVHVNGNFDRHGVPRVYQG